MDRVVELVIFASVAGALLLAFLSGFLTPVAGRWRDGERVIELTQFGPFVRGRADLEGGYELYRGTVVFGTLRIKRCDYGRERLVRAGFPAEVVPALEGEVMVSFKLSLEGATLEGTFEARRFAFTGNPPQVSEVTAVPAAPRTWSYVA